MAGKQGDDNAPDQNTRLLPGRDARLEQLGQRAEAAGLNAWWTQFRNPATGQWEGPYGMRVNLRSGRGFRSVNLMGGDEAAVLLQFPFEQWTVLQGYQAILDPNGQRIVAAVTLRGTTLSNIPGVVIRPPEEEPNEELVSGSVAELRAAFRLSGPQLGLRSLTIASADGDLAVELHSQAPAEIEALRGSSNRIGQAMVIRGVSTHRHDEAHALLEDLAAAVFIELDRSYGLAGTLSRATGDDPIQQEYDEEPISSLPPRLPSARYGRDAASLYLYARTVSFQLPLLEYLG
ncbi:hypothetical protein AB0C07_34415 [Actinoplanes missouriensis]|uniref:hypothetical protein n=1 Tax=Actinoplanes missouriensis TaxID=1866 RepID=UPI0033EA4C06